MNSQPLVSILMTAYNREKYIAEAIESVLASTYTNFELIIVDDCSTDETVNIATSYEAKDSRIKVFVNEKNLGDYPNRNRAASYAEGKYLKYLDADDLIYPHSLDIMVNGMENHPEAAIGIEQYAAVNINKPFPLLVKPDWVARNQFLKFGVIDCGPSGAIIRASIFKEMEGFSGKRFVGDTELWMRIAFQYPILFFQPALVFWRSHDEQEIRKEKKETGILLTRYKTNKQFILSPTTPLSEAERLLAIKKLNRRLLNNLVKSTSNYITLQQKFRLFKDAKLKVIDIFDAIFH